LRTTATQKSAPRENDVREIDESVKKRLAERHKGAKEKLKGD
jgi:hypothetical protein